MTSEEFRTLANIPCAINSTGELCIACEECESSPYAKSGYHAQSDESKAKAKWYFDNFRIQAWGERITSCHGNVQKAASYLGLCRTTLLNKIKMREVLAQKLIELRKRFRPYG
jgi:DNA-binding NtrC family response regulator